MHDIFLVSEGASPLYALSEAEVIGKSQADRLFDLRNRMPVETPVSHVASLIPPQKRRCICKERA